MKIKTGVRINSLVDLMPSHMMLNVADLVIPTGGEISDKSGAEAHAKGVEAGVALATLAQKRSSAIGGSASIYRAQQLTSDGFDTLYFVGKEKEIVTKLRRAIAAG
jgi:hypothetical protein